MCMHACGHVSLCVCACVCACVKIMKLVLRSWLETPKIIMMTMMSFKFYIALFSTLEQAHRAFVTCDSK